MRSRNHGSLELYTLGGRHSIPYQATQFLCFGKNLVQASLCLERTRYEPVLFVELRRRAAQA